MTAHIFNPSDYAKLVQRIQLLQPISTRQWGTMNVEDMCWHCRQQLEFVLQPAPIKVLRTLLRFPPVRWLTIYVVPWPKGAATAPAMDAQKHATDIAKLETEKEKLLHALEAVAKLPSIVATHPLFGTLKKPYWGRLIWKHLDHHLRQFNC